MPEFQSMAKMWADFETQVLPADVGPIQRQEMRRAFYSGAKGFIDMILLFLDPVADPTRADCEHMDKIYAELEAFGVDVQQGKA